jgi:GT2 family glycosyltransferase
MKMHPAMDLSIVIVNWNSAAFLRQCLRSIYTTCTAVEFEVIVIDNASFDSSELMVRREFPAIKFIQSNENLGFAGANNLGFEHSSGRNILFLNPDTELTGDALSLMCSVLDATPDAGSVGCKLLNTDSSLQTSCVQAFPSILNQALDVEFLQRLFPNSSLWGMRPLYSRGSRVAVVDIISGACLMVRRIVFEQVGQFSMDYFMYAEDMDLCYKVIRAGWRNYFVRDAEVIHHGGRSSSIRPNYFAAMMMRESKLTFMRIWHGRAYALCYQWATAIMSIARLLILAVALPLATILRQRQKVQKSIAKWFKILLWSVGFEKWVRTYVHPLSASGARSPRQDATTAPKAAGEI